MVKDKLLDIKFRNKTICILGWYYWKEFYDNVNNLKNYFNIFIVAHRYNKILDNLNLRYKLIRNIGFEYHGYNYFLRNRWNKKSDVLFLQDDLIILRENAIKEIFFKSYKFDFVKWYGKDKKGKLRKSGARVIYCSNKILYLISKKTPGIVSSEVKEKRKASFNVKLLKNKYKIKQTKKFYKYIIFCSKGKKI